ncbi:hypothetical protein SCH01S_21_00820 [Sphingomonas changbaiensis NBRC 104936]|uniref:EF-hand domain-containing protein n=1 Tax=Sphingomonas changbaiensis NBRC 104936 TaxID=1219043 RepID=A0A0E9MP71_9SPHN|nr:hypothetical protein [Sphingomonas changbaiensis]GAO38895.1 hypothetical protein SCH01S_21_00820 [Sphingomonas changbaiensis NBRC 104936]
MNGLLSAILLAASAQTPPLAPQASTVVEPVLPPATVVKQVAPDAFTVTNIPGLAVAKRVEIQRFSDYDLNHDGSYGPMEFAQAAYFLATGDPVPGTTAIPRPGQYLPHLAYAHMNPKFAAALLNATSDEFTAIDSNHDWRVTPAELDRYARG